MRWFWIDRFTELVSGQNATAIKTIALNEDQLLDHFSGYPIMPHSLIIEGMAQTGGLLVCEHYDFQERVVLAKLSKTKFHFDAVPGDTLTYRATLDNIASDGAMSTVTCHVGDRLQAEAEIFFAHLDQDQGEEMFEPLVMLQWLRSIHLFDVGVNPDGSKISVPQHLAEAELKTDQPLA